MLIELGLGVTNSADCVPERVGDDSVGMFQVQEIQPVLLLLSYGSRLHHGNLVLLLHGSPADRREL